MSTSLPRFEIVFESPDLAPAGDAMKAWLESKPDLPFFTFAELMHALEGKATAEQLNRALLRLVNAGELRVTYRVRIKEGEYSEDEFDTSDEIPPCVFDSAFDPVEVDERAKVPSYTIAR